MQHTQYLLILCVICGISSTTHAQAFSASDAYQCVMQNLADAKRDNRPLQEVVNERVNRNSLAAASAMRAWRKNWQQLTEVERTKVLAVVDDWLSSTDTLSAIDKDSVVVSPRVIRKPGYYEVSGYFTVRGIRETFVLFIAQRGGGCEVIELEWQNARLSFGIARDLQ